MRNEDLASTATPTPISRRSTVTFWLLWLLWLPLFIPSIVGLFQAHPHPLWLAISLAGAALFFALYLRVTWQNARTLASPLPLAQPTGMALWAPVLVMVALSMVFVGPNGQAWGSLFIYTSASASGRLPTAQALRVLGVLFVFTLVGAGFLQHYSQAQLLSALPFVLIPGLCVIGFRHSLLASQHLRVAREEMARLAAVTEERLRIARDLHDLLGHNLSVIALKSELARRLVGVAPQRAAAEIGDIESVARTALQEVREAVAGYRQPTLVGELAGAREVLAAAGIAARVEDTQRASRDLPPAIDAALAWAVREGITNMLRHSHARSCLISMTRQPQEVSVELRDDGAPAKRGTAAASATIAEHASPSATPTPGNGLRGLAERMEALGGRCEAGPLPEGGFRLHVSIPLPEPEPRVSPAVVSPAVVSPAVERVDALAVAERQP